MGKYTFVLCHFAQHTRDSYGYKMNDIFYKGYYVTWNVDSEYKDKLETPSDRMCSMAQQFNINFDIINTCNRSYVCSMQHGI